MSGFTNLNNTQELPYKILRTRILNAMDNKTHLRKKTFLPGSLIIIALAAHSFIGWGQVKVQEETMTIPTYKNGDPNPMPRFYEGRSHQGVQRRIYPYPYDDNQTNVKSDVIYPYIHVANEFIDLGIMPQLGGRIYYAVDKTNNYNWFYHNAVVKPSLIGMVGNWISGSLAWGYPHHHGPNTVEPMDYKITENANGSKTVWISTTDERHRMSILVGYTVYPNSSLVEMTIHPLNKTAISNSFLFWANPAVHCDTSYQVIFPPSVKYVTYHGKRDMTTWPVADSRFNGYDFTGYDVSWWKNTFIPSSFFSWDPREDYFGGYDHAKEAGTVWVGNHYVSPGMKYWADGNNPSGLRTNNGLTDNSGRYIEMMAGFYTDNQPDYSWLQPYETKLGTMTWFPVRDLDGLKYANRNGALNIDASDGKMIKLRINTTSPNNDAIVLLKTTKGQVLLQKTINISPAAPFRNDMPLPSGIKDDDLDITLRDAKGNILLSYRPAEHHPPDYPRPEPLKAFPPPEEMKSVEELYLAGLRLNQFYNATVDPMPYYNEGLKRDPGDYRINTQLGILNIKDFKWADAEKYLRTAVARITSNYTRPKDCEGLYYLGLALRAQNKSDEAYDLFYQASWASAWHSASYYQLAEIDCIRGDYVTALDHLNRAISTNTDNPKALDLKSVVLRKMNNLTEAKNLVLSTLNNYKIDHQALNELYLIDKQSVNQGQAASDLQELEKLMRDNVQSYLELATYYINCGFYEEASDLLSRLESKGATFPMIYYYLGYLQAKLGDGGRALTYYKMANTMPSTYCFPFRAEEIDILENAILTDPSGAKAPYYLGDLLYEHQPEKAVALWEKSGKLDDSFYIVHRNLGLAYRDLQKDYTKALVSLDKAAACNSDDPRLLVEVDALNELNKVSPQKKYEFLKARAATAMKRSDALLCLVTRSVEYGKYDEAINLITTNTIRESEGARGMQNAYLNAYTLRGLESLGKGKYEKARKDIETAQAFPVGLVGRGRTAQFNYLLGLINKKTGKKAEAESLFQKTIEVNIENQGSDREYLYYKGLALRELGKNDESIKLFREMLDNIQNRRGDNAFFTQFEGGQSAEARLAQNHYLAGLAYEGIGDNVKAKAEFSEALKINPGLIWSKVHLDSL
jgi:tetratricopeptide (TPR) repeat protein